MNHGEAVLAAGAGAYTSTATMAAVADRLRAARRVAVVTHSRPDGDAMGSALAVVRTMRALGADATAWFLGPMPGWWRAVTGSTPVQLVPGRTPGADGAPGPAPVPWGGAEPDVVVVLDTGSWGQLEEVREWLRRAPERVVLVDHHLQGDPSVAAMRVIDARAAATAELVAELADLLLGAREARAGGLARDVAEALYLGIATDTGWFRFSNTRPETMRLAARLMECGVDHARLFTLVEQQDRPARIRLMARALGSMELAADGRVALLFLRERDFRDTGAESEDTGGFNELVQSLASVQVSAVITEMGAAPGRGRMAKVSLRSKPGPHAVDVAAVAARLGGGGHARAAGTRLPMTLDEARLAVLDALGAA